MANKVLHIIDNMGVGGAQRILLSLLENSSNHKVHALRSSETSMSDSKAYTVTDSEQIYKIKSLLDCRELVKEYDPDIVHCHMPSSKLIGIGLKLLYRKKFSLVMHEHGYIWEDNDRYRKILIYSSGIVDCHIAVSQHTAELLQNKAGIPEEKIRTIYNFVDREKYNSELLENFKSELVDEINKESFVAGFSGRLEERKGWKTIISAAEKEKDIEFIVSGVGSGKEQIKRKSRELENLHYLGFLDDIRTLFANIDCFVLPSHWDPSPMILYELQSCGVPLACSDVPSINEVIEDEVTGLTFPSIISVVL